MKKKKLLILIVLFIAITGLAISTSSAKTHTTNVIKFKDDPNYGVTKNLGKGEKLNLFYTSKYSPQLGKSNSLIITIYNSYGPESKYYDVTKAKIKFMKKENGKYKTTTKYLKGSFIFKTLPKGWKPYSTVVTYKDI